MKPIDDRGHALVALKPFGLKRYEPTKLPDPGQCVDCIVIVNDRHDGQPRGRLAVSNGASWDRIAWLDEIKVTPAATATPPAVDLTPLVNAAVAEMLPAITPLKVISPPAKVQTDDMAAVATALLELSQTVERLMRDNHDLTQRVAFLESYSLSNKTKIIREEAS